MTEKIIICPSGVEAVKENPYPIPDERAFTHLEYWDFEANNPPLPLIGSPQVPGERFEAKIVWQYLYANDNWGTVTDKEHAEWMEKMRGRTIRQAYQIITSKEETPQLGEVEGLAKKYAQGFGVPYRNSNIKEAFIAGYSACMEHVEKIILHRQKFLIETDSRAFFDAIKELTEIIKLLTPPKH